MLLKDVPEILSKVKIPIPKKIPTAKPLISFFAILKVLFSLVLAFGFSDFGIKGVSSGWGVTMRTVILLGTFII